MIFKLDVSRNISVKNRKLNEYCKSNDRLLQIEVPYIDDARLISGGHPLVLIDTAQTHWGHVVAFTDTAKFTT